MSDIVTDISVNKNWHARKGYHNPFTFTFTNSGSAFNISSYTFSLQVRRFGSSTNLISLTQGSGLTNGGATGILTGQFSAATTSGMVASEYYWQLSVVQPDTFSYVIFNGTFVLHDETYTGDTTSSVSVALSLTGSDVDVTVTLSGGSSTWGSITGTLSNQTDLNSALSGKQATLVSGTNIKTINSTSILGSGNIDVMPLSGTATLLGTLDIDADGYAFNLTNAEEISLAATTQISLTSGLNYFSSPLNQFTGGNVGLDNSAYINWGTTYGASGYGIRDNAGTMEFKNSAGSWTGFGSGGGGGTWGSITGTLSAQTDLQTTLDGKWALTGTSTLTGATDIVGSTSNILQHTFNSLGTTQTNGAGLWLRNTTAAAAGAQQKSPSLVLEGQGWKTNATAASESVKFSIDVLPAQGAANPSGALYIRSSINGGAYTSGNGAMSLSSIGEMALQNSLTISGLRILVFNGGAGTIAADSSSQLYLRANGTSTVVTNGYYRFGNVSNYSNTSGNMIVGQMEMPFAPTSGTGTITGWNITGTVNQTGGANGNVFASAVTNTVTAAGGNFTGYYYNPTVTSISGTEYAFHGTRGNLLLGGATMATSGTFSFNNTNKVLSLNGMRIWTDHDTNGKDNHFIGYNSGNTSVTGIDNLGFGPGTLTDVTSGSDNIAFGNLAGNDVTQGSNNILIGKFAGNAITTTSGNILIGSLAGQLVTGSNNVVIGQSAGDALTSGSGNVLIGIDIDAQSNTANNQLSIQNAIFGSGNSASGTLVSTGNLGLFATTWGTSAARVLSLGNGTAPSTSITDGVQIWAEDVSSSSELRVRDEAGNVTTLSPHNFSLIGKPSEDGAWSYYSEYTNSKGEREAVNIDMLKLARLVEQLTGEKLVYKTKLKDK